MDPRTVPVLGPCGSHPVPLPTFAPVPRAGADLAPLPEAVAFLLHFLSQIDDFRPGRPPRSFPEAGGNCESTTNSRGRAHRGCPPRSGCVKRINSKRFTSFRRGLKYLNSKLYKLPIGQKKLNSKLLQKLPAKKSVPKVGASPKAGGNAAKAGSQQALSPRPKYTVFLKCFNINNLIHILNICINFMS